MLRSMYAANSGLRSSQQFLDVTANNIANANTAGFKSAGITFQDTLSQTVVNSGAPGTGIGGSNPAQVGLGVKTGGITTNFTQGALQNTGRATDVAINGGGFFVVAKGGENFLTRAGSFNVDGAGQLVTTTGELVQGFTMVNGQPSAQLGPIVVGLGATSAPIATTQAAMSGNLPLETAAGAALTRDIPGFDATGQEVTVAMTFTRTATGWDMSLNTPTGAAAGVFGTDLTMTAGGVTVDLAQLTSFVGLDSAKFASQNGRATGAIDSYEIGADGSVIGAFSNGTKQTLSMLAMANVINPEGLEKSGNSLYSPSPNSGATTYGVAGSNGIGSLTTRAIEMSNTDMSTEMTNVISAQRALQANSRIISVSSSNLEELVNLPR